MDKLIPIIISFFPLVSFAAIDISRQYECRVTVSNDSAIQVGAKNRSTSEVPSVSVNSLVESGGLIPLTNPDGTLAEIFLYSPVAIFNRAAESLYVATDPRISNETMGWIRFSEASDHLDLHVHVAHGFVVADDNKSTIRLNGAGKDYDLVCLGNKP